MAKQLICVAHRGAMGYEPENTLRAIQRALDLGAHWVEIDVHRGGDRLYVIHDSGVERTTNGQGLVEQLPYEYLRSLDAGKGERIPLLEEVFEVIDRRAGLLIEIKSLGCAALVAHTIESFVAKGWDYDAIRVGSFVHREVREVRTFAPAVKTGVFFYGLPLDASFAEPLGLSLVMLNHNFLDAAFVEDAHTRGLDVFAYTVNDERDISRVLQMNVDGLIGNYPDRLLAHCSQPATD